MMRKTYQRILIAAGTYADAEPALRLAGRLIADSAEELGGLLIEDTLLGELAALPRQRVVTVAGNLVEAPSQERFRSLLESDARAFRDSLSALAQSRKWFFDRQSGELVSLIFAAAGLKDMLILGHRTTHRVPGRVVLVVPPAEAVHDALHLAEALARAFGTETVALSLPGSDASGALPELEQLPDEAALLARIGQIHASAVILDLSAGPLHEADQLRAVLATARCPVVVLGAGQSRAAADGLARG